MPTFSACKAKAVIVISTITLYYLFSPHNAKKEKDTSSHNEKKGKRMLLWNAFDVIIFYSFSSKLLWDDIWNQKAFERKWY